MKKYILSVLLLFNAILLAFGVGVFSVENIKPTNFASVQSEQEIISQEPPTELADLQKAGSGQLDYWAENLDAFDGRDFGFVTPARSQGSKNICWAYAAVGAVEASILREGIDETATKETLNFDEMIAAYTSLNRDGGPDPLLLTTNDKFNYGTWNQGGHSVNALAIMTQGYTLVDEKYFYTSIDESALKTRWSSPNIMFKVTNKFKTTKTQLSVQFCNMERWCLVTMPQAASFRDITTVPQL